MRISTEDSKQRGASALEASFAMIPVCLACLLGVELVHAHQSKQLVSLALHEAGRQASVTAADPDQVERAFARALSPLFTPAGRHASPHKRQEATIARYAQLYGLPLWQLALNDVEVGSLKSPEYRSVQLDLIYLHEPLHAWLRQVLGQSARWLKAKPFGLAAHAQQQGLVAIRLSRRVMLHASEVKQSSKSLSENATQQPEQALDGLQTRGYGPPPPEPRLILQRAETALHPSSQNLPPTKASTLGTVQRELDEQHLCGVLLCCAP
jgi:hypothetical protein